MLYKLELVKQKYNINTQTVVGDNKVGDFHVFRVQRIGAAEDYAPSEEIINAFSNASKEVQAVFSKVVAQRD